MSGSVPQLEHYQSRIEKIKSTERNLFKLGLLIGKQNTSGDPAITVAVQALTTIAEVAYIKAVRKQKTLAEAIHGQGKTHGVKPADIWAGDRVIHISPPPR
jgi:hypothetical protein